MANNEDGNGSPGRGLVELIGRALTDKEIRKRLFEDQQKLAAEFDLPEKDIEALSTLDPGLFENAAERLVGRAEWTIKVVIKKSF